MVQTSNLLFPGPGKAKGSGFQFALSRAGKKQNGSDFQFAFSRAWKKQKAQTSNLLFPGLGKSKTVQTSNLLFPGPGKSKQLRLILLFPAREKAKWFRLPLAFSRPAKSKRLDFQFASWENRFPLKHSGEIICNWGDSNPEPSASDPGALSIRPQLLDFSL